MGVCFHCYEDRAIFGVGQTPVPGTPDPMVIQTPGGSHSSDRGEMELAAAGGITTSKTASICVVEWPFHTSIFRLHGEKGSTGGSPDPYHSWMGITNELPCFYHGDGNLPLG